LCTAGCPTEKFRRVITRINLQFRWVITRHTNAKTSLIHMDGQESLRRKDAPILPHHFLLSPSRDLYQTFMLSKAPQIFVLLTRVPPNRYPARAKVMLTG
jgi:hypothetical protein